MHQPRFRYGFALWSFRFWRDCCLCGSTSGALGCRWCNFGSAVQPFRVTAVAGGEALGPGGVTSSGFLVAGPVYSDEAPAIHAETKLLLHMDRCGNLRHSIFLRF